MGSEPVSAETVRGGVNVAGYLRSRTGVGTVARRYVRALRALGAPLALKDLTELNPVGTSDNDDARFDTEFPYSTNLICVNAVEYPAFAWYVGEPFLRDRYNIGVWFWELQTFPSEWLDRFEHYDELWAPTTFIASTLAPISPVPVVPMPVVLATTATAVQSAPAAREQGRQRLGLGPDDYAFLFVFDFMSYIERKNPMALIEAFRLAFPAGDRGRARLIIKCVNTDFDPPAFAELQARASGFPIDIISGYWSGQEMQQLLAASDAFVSLHRSEGLGLTMAEAMAYGKPVIATEWSGNTDYMNVSNSFPVRYRLVELDHDVGPYRAGSIWAEPSVEHAAELLRQLHDDPSLGEVRGKTAAASIDASFSATAVGERIGTRLRVISARVNAAREAVDAQRPPQHEPHESQAPVVPPMELETSIYGWPGRLAKRGIAFLLSYHTIFQQQVNSSFANFLRVLERAQEEQQIRLDAHDAALEQLRRELRDARDDLEAAIRTETVTRGQRAYAPLFDGCRSVLVLGASGSELARLLLARGIRVAGADPDANLVARAVDRGLPFVRSDVAAFLTCAAERVDAIFLAPLGADLYEGDLVGLLSAAHGRLAPGGIFLAEGTDLQPAMVTRAALQGGFSSARVLYNTLEQYAVLAVAGPVHDGGA